MGFPREIDYVVENNNINYARYNEHSFQWFLGLFLTTHIYPVKFFDYVPPY